MKRRPFFAGILSFLFLILATFPLTSVGQGETISIQGTESSLNAALAMLKEKERAQIRLLERLTPSLVAIYPRDGSSGGSGVLISDDGFVLTNFHIAMDFFKCSFIDNRSDFNGFV